MLLPGLDTSTGSLGSPSLPSSSVAPLALPSVSLFSGTRSDTEQIVLLPGSNRDRVASEIWSLKDIHFFHDWYGNTPIHLSKFLMSPLTRSLSSSLTVSTISSVCLLHLLTTSSPRPKLQKNPVLGATLRLGRLTEL